MPKNNKLINFKEINREDTIDSREVAEMVEKGHKELLRDIRRYCEQFAESNIALGDFFIESTYKDANNQSRPCYLVTKKGCEFIAHKLTGIKGTQFTAKYIERFHEMEDTLVNQQQHIPKGKELLALAVLEAQKTIEEMKPHAVLGKAITTANTSILVGDMAKILRQNGIEMGGTRLFQWLRDNGYLIKRKGTDWNMPTQKSMEQGLFEIKESVHINGNGCNVITKTPKISGKGQQYFVNKFLAENRK